jgi:hypothetical protein
MNTYTKPFAHKPVRAIKKRFTEFNLKGGEFINLAAIEVSLKRVFPSFKKPKNQGILQVLGAMTKPDLYKFLLATKGA